MEEDKYVDIILDFNFLRQNKTAVIIAALIVIGLVLVTTSKFYNAGKTRQTASILQEAASTSNSVEEIVPLEEITDPTATPPKTLSYEVKAGDFLEKIIADVCGEVGGKTTTTLRNRDRLAIGQTLEISCN